MRNLNDLLAQDKKAKQFFLTLSEDVQGSLIQNTKIACRICLYRPATFLPCHHQAG